MKCTYLLLCFLASFLCFSCTKPSIEPVTTPDPVPIPGPELPTREVYQGNVLYEYDEYYPNPNQPPITDYDSTYTDSLVITPDSVANFIQVKRGGMEIRLPKMEENSTYTRYSTGQGSGAPYYSYHSYELYLYDNRDSAVYTVTSGQQSGSVNYYNQRSRSTFTGTK